MFYPQFSTIEFSNKMHYGTDFLKKFFLEIFSTGNISFMGMKGLHFFLLFSSSSQPHFFPGRIIIDGANLTISNVTMEDEGIYSCSAYTALDSVADMTQVTVLGKCTN